MRRRTLLLGTAAGLALLVGLAVGWRIVAGNSARAHVAKLKADLDDTDPGWRLEDLLADREQAFPPDDQNPITVTEAVPRLLPQAYKDWQVAYPDWLPPDPNRLPRPEDAGVAACARWEASAAIAEARKLRHLTRPGGVRLTITPDVIGTLIPHTQHVRESASLLSFDAVMAAYEGDPDRAVESVHAGVLAARANGDEPFMISMLVRVACAAIARGALERVLGLSEPRAGLAELQAAFAAEAEASVLTAAFRGERAGMNRLFENIDNGTVPLTTVVAVAAAGGGPPTPMDRFRAWRYRGNLPADHAKMLETYTRYVEISRRPTHEQAQLFKQVPRPPDEARYLLTRLLLPASVKVAEADLRNKATLRATVAAIACERFRLARGRWPESLEEVPKAILPEIPLDAYDGKPIRYRRTRDGAVVYSVGPDLADDGGNVTRRYRLDPGEDYGFQLWDPEHRRAEPLPPPAEDDPEGNGWLK